MGFGENLGRMNLRRNQLYFDRDDFELLELVQEPGPGLIPTIACKIQGNNHNA